MGNSFARCTAPPGPWLHRNLQGRLTRSEARRATERLRFRATSRQPVDSLHDGHRIGSPGPASAIQPEESPMNTNISRGCSVRACIAVALIAALSYLPGCAVDGGSATSSGAADELAAAAAAISSDEASSSEESSVDSPDLAANCSIVQFCNAPGPEGTRCVQQGCDGPTAEAECVREARTICGPPVCPFIFVDLNGRHI